MRRTVLPMLVGVTLILGCENPNDGDQRQSVPTEDHTGTTPAPGQRAPTNSPSADPSGERTPPNGTPTTSGAAVSRDAQVLSILLLKDQQEAAIGRLAQGKAASPEAKQLADALVNDHTEHAQRVSDLAASQGLTLLSQDQAKQEWTRMQGAATPPPDPAGMLEPLSGPEFDATFGELMAQGHRDLIRVLESARESLTSQEVRAMVDQTIPVLKHHEELAQAINGTRTSP